MKFLMLGLMTLFLVSCASLTQKAKSLKITKNKVDVINCVQTGKVQASTSGGGGEILVANYNSKIKLLNMAAEYGDTVLMLKDSENIFGSEREGVVYRCPGSI